MRVHSRFAMPGSGLAPLAWFSVAGVVFIVAYGLATYFEVWLGLVDGVLYHVPALLGYLLAPRAIRASAGRERLAWLLFLGMLLLWDAAEWTYTVYYFTTGDWGPFPGIPDIFYFAGYATLLPAIVLFQGGLGGVRDRRAAVDSLIIAVVVGAVMWQFAVAPNLDGSPDMGDVVLTAYPMLDFAAIALLLIGMARSFHRTPAGVIITASVAFVVVTDSVNLMLYDRGNDLLDMGWLAGYWLTAVAFLARPGMGTPGSPDDTHESSWFAVLAPYAASLPLLWYTLAEALAGELHPALIAGCLAAASLVLLRQWLTIQDNRRLYALLADQNVELASRAEELEAARAAAVYAADHDGLTGVLNRRAWFESTNVAPPAAIAIFDIDHFKQINDTHGHPAGDAVLQQVAGRLTASFGRAATVGRIGGEEFAVAFYHPAQPTELCQAAVQAVAAAAFQLPSGAALAVTLSGGLALWRGTTDETYAAADAALLQAKRTGRNRLVHSLPHAA